MNLRKLLNRNVIIDYVKVFFCVFPFSFANFCFICLHAQFALISVISQSDARYAADPQHFDLVTLSFGK